MNGRELFDEEVRLKAGRRRGDGKSEVPWTDLEHWQRGEYEARALRATRRGWTVNKAAKDRDWASWIGPTGLS